MMNHQPLNLKTIKLFVQLFSILSLMTEETDGILILKSFWWSNNHDGDMLTAKIEKMPIFKRRRERRRNWICTTNHPPDPYFQKAIISILLQHFILVTVDFYRMKSIPFLNCVFYIFHFTIIEWFSTQGGNFTLNV